MLIINLDFMFDYQYCLINILQFCLFFVQNNFGANKFKISLVVSTVKPVYNGHPWDQKKPAV